MIDRQVFGRTGHTSTRTLLGAAAFWSTTQAETDETLELAFSYGVNHIDVAASYGDAELRVGSWIQRHGKSFFLATKTEERMKGKAREGIQKSLERLHVDQVDLIQLHNLVDAQEWEIAFGQGGALEAVIEARDEGLVRFIGVTGHGLAAPRQHYLALERFPFDSVLLPYSYMLAQNPRYQKEFARLAEICQDRKVAVQTIKSIVARPWGDAQQTFSTWYQPLARQEDIDLAVHWVFGHPNLFLNTAGDIHLLPKVLSAADRFKDAPELQEMESLATRNQMQPLFT